MRKLLIAGLMASAAFPAFAADIVETSPIAEAPLAAPAGFSWTGAYIGVQLGYAWGSADHSFADGVTGTPAPVPYGDSSPDGFLGGVHVGYNHQINQLVLGVEADIEYSDIDGAYEDWTDGTSSGATEINWQGSVRARLGYAMDRTLLYATGGVAFADVDYWGGPAGDQGNGYSDTRTGWTIGAGVEHAFTSNLTARLEYRYSDFGSVTGGLNPDYSDVDMTTDLDTHAVRVGISYKF